MSQYEKDKKARDSVLNNLIKNGVQPEKARRIVQDTVERVTNKRKEK